MILQPFDDGRIGIANLKQHLGAAWDDAGCARIERDLSRGPYRARPAQRGEGVVDGHAKSCQGQPCVLANRHAGGAGVILLARKTDPELPDADDGGDDADRKGAAFERLALLDMGFQISDVTPAPGVFARAAGEPGLAQRLPHGPAARAVARRVDIGLGDRADKGAAAEKTAEMAFLIAP